MQTQFMCPGIAAIVLSVAAAAGADVNNTVIVNVLPNFSGGSGRYQELHTQPGYVQAQGSATGGFNSSGAGVCHVDYGTIDMTGDSHGSLNTACVGIFRDSLTFTSPSVPNGTTGTVTFTVNVDGSLGATSGSSGSSWHVQADLGGGVTDINKSATCYSPELNPNGCVGDPLGNYSATVQFTYGQPIQLYVELQVSANTGYGSSGAGNAAFGNPFRLTWQGLSNFTANGNPVASVDVGAASGTDWTGEIGGDPCAADLNNDGQVDGADLGTLLGMWNGQGAADFNNDGVVDGADLGTLLGEWGPCN